MQRAESPGSLALDAQIDGACRGFADVAALAADLYEAAQLAANATIPVLDAKIDARQKELEHFILRIVQMQQEQKIDKQERANLRARAEAAWERCRRVAALAGRFSDPTPSTQPRSTNLWEYGNMSALQTNNAGNSLHLDVFTNTEADTHPPVAGSVAGSNFGEASASLPVIHFQSIEASDAEAVLASPGQTGDSSRSQPNARGISVSRNTCSPELAIGTGGRHTTHDNGQSRKRRRLNQDDASTDHPRDAPQAQKDVGKNKNSPRNTQKRKYIDGVTNPDTGKLYLGRWGTSSASKKSSWYAVIVLPLGSFESVGMTGSIDDTELVEGHIPVCYKSAQKRILGWQNDYEDGGSKVAKRKFPVMWFEDDQPQPLQELTPSPWGSFSWLSAKNLRPFSEYGPDGSPVSGYDVAWGFAKELTAMKTAPILSSERFAASNEVNEVNTYRSPTTSSQRLPQLSQAGADREVSTVSVANKGRTLTRRPSSTTVQEQEEAERDDLFLNTETHQSSNVGSCRRQNSTVHPGASNTQSATSGNCGRQSTQSLSTPELVSEPTLSGTSTTSLLTLAAQAAARTLRVLPRSGELAAALQTLDEALGLEAMHPDGECPHDRQHSNYEARQTAAAFHPMTPEGALTPAPSPLQSRVGPQKAGDLPSATQLPGIITSDLAARPLSFSPAAPSVPSTDAPWPFSKHGAASGCVELSLPTGLNATSAMLQDEDPATRDVVTSEVAEDAAPSVMLQAPSGTNQAVPMTDYRNNSTTGYRGPAQQPNRKRKRSFRGRTKTGCMTCRKRKKKCGEQKPECIQCIRGGFPCAGYQSRHVMRYRKRFTKTSLISIRPKPRRSANSNAAVMPKQSPFPNSPCSQQRQDMLQACDRQSPIGSVQGMSSSDDLRLMAGSMPNLLTPLGSATPAGPIRPELRQSTDATRAPQAVDQAAAAAQEEILFPPQAVALEVQEKPSIQAHEAGGKGDESLLPKSQAKPFPNQGGQGEKASSPVSATRIPLRPLPNGDPSPSTLTERGPSLTTDLAGKNPTLPLLIPKGATNAGKPPPLLEDHSPDPQALLGASQTSMSHVQPHPARQSPRPTPCCQIMAIQSIISADEEIQMMEAASEQCNERTPPSMEQAVRVPLPAGRNSAQLSAAVQKVVKDPKKALDAPLAPLTTHLNTRTMQVPAQISRDTTGSEKVQHNTLRAFGKVNGSHRTTQQVERTLPVLLPQQTRVQTEGRSRFVPRDRCAEERFLHEMVRYFEPIKGKGMWQSIACAFNAKFNRDLAKETLQMRYKRLTTAASVS